MACRHQSRTRQPAAGPHQPRRRRAQRPGPPRPHHRCEHHLHRARNNAVRRASRISRGHHQDPEKQPVLDHWPHRFRTQRLPLHHRSRPRRRLTDGDPHGHRHQTQTARRLRRRTRHLGLRLHRRPRPRPHRQIRLPHRRRREPDPPAALRRVNPRPPRKPHLPVHQRARPAPHPVHQSHPPRDRRRSTLGSPGPRRRTSLSHHRRSASTRPVPAPRRPGRHVLRRARNRRRTSHRRPAQPPRSRCRTTPARTHRRGRLARLTQTPGVAGPGRKRTNPNPFHGDRRTPTRRRPRRGGRPGLAHRPHRRPRDQRRAAALAPGQHPTTTRRPHLGPIPATAPRVGHRYGRPDPRHLPHLDPRDRAGLGQSTHRR
ncbi:Uncharacterised protein [Mycobacteroides abscessus subsp. abscessus]|nr:Uncharacterised protein [Mycobacteroides abscessus subsp. abscessus]SHV74106.1 Uncharacterised protein [Mycobacteroides abscessus subsp. abscessus]SIL26649.1 Uncharacterised protein [Mycobacteroides abscessus subsp. abscessus]